MLDIEVEFISRDLDKQRMSEEELDKLIGKRDYRDFLNSRNEMFRRRNMKEKPPTRAEAIKLMAKEPNLIRRPILLYGDQILLGFDENAYRKLL